MFDAKKLLDQLLGSQVPGTTGTVRDKADGAVKLAKGNPLATGAIAAALLGTKTGRKLAGNVAVVGGLAAIAGLGYQAYRNYQQGKAPGAAEPAAPASEPLVLAPPPAQSGFEPDVLSNDFVLVLVRAMIAAAKADGHIDEAERARIVERGNLAGLGGEAEAFLAEELASPTDIDALVGAARTEEQKVELYTASRLAIDPDSRAERGYLDLLAGRLALDDALVDHIEATVSAHKA
ncbi:tellurite resistance TerB family protein [Rhizobiaceae bacterium BDR2-2]|uniref:Tellurite resistance TerB family protein n=1 Tax=Ectorhizobium quercum TaxID=2965071 RepID=A0AAE3SU54_9HYPH|nr:tellurite resistance TerB family protein [Ectorhizobium quercum]MCX8996875.1 tellurite resistance TerB family protein [Ectorhizobium quercum]